MALFRTREVSTADEASFAEYAAAPASMGWDYRIPVLDATLDAGQDRQDDQSLQVRANASRPGYLMPRTGKLTIRFCLPGANQATTGSIATSWAYELLKHALGGGNIASVGGTASGSGSAVSLPFSGATLVRGGGIRVGAKGDGLADGQFAVVGATVTTPATILTGMPGIAAASDVINAAQVVYPTESGQTSRRFLLGWSATGAQYVCAGCQAESVAFNFTMGALPECTITYRVAYWDRHTLSVPQVASLEECYAAPIAGGSVFYNTTGTATRATIAPVELSLSLDMGLGDIVGLGGTTYQTITGMERTHCKPTFSCKVAWSTDYEALYDADGAASTMKHILVTLNSVSKKSIGFYLPDAYIVGPRPDYPEDYNGLLYHTLTFRGDEGPDTTDELTKSAFRMFLS